MSDTIRYVRIVKIPTGDAPEWVRAAWVGLVLPDMGPPESHMSYGLLTSKPRKNDFGCCILMKDSLAILAAKSPEAAQWFFDNIGPARIERGTFVFQEEECEPVPTLPPPAIDSPIQDI